MSFAIHFFTLEKFSEESYRRFLTKVQNLYGKWDLVESEPFHDALHYEDLHVCCIQSNLLPVGENFRVHIDASKYIEGVSYWGFKYERALHLETSAGRSCLGLAVQLGALLVALQEFQFLHFVDRDIGDAEHEPVECRTTEAVREHVRRIINEVFTEYVDDLKQRGILDENGDLLLPSAM